MVGKVFLTGNSVVSGSAKSSKCKTQFDDQLLEISEFREFRDIFHKFGTFA